MKMMTLVASQEFVGVFVQLGDKDRLERYKNKSSFASQNSSFSVSFEINKNKAQGSTKDDGVDNEACLEYEVGTKHTCQCMFQWRTGISHIQVRILNVLGLDLSRTLQRHGVSSGERPIIKWFPK